MPSKTNLIFIDPAKQEILTGWKKMDQSKRHNGQNGLMLMEKGEGHVNIQDNIRIWDNCSNQIQLCPHS